MKESPYNKFYAGEAVTCVDDSDSGGSLTEGSTYIVAENRKCDYNDSDCFLKVYNNNKVPEEWFLYRFRKVRKELV